MRTKIKLAAGIAFAVMMGGHISQSVALQGGEEQEKFQQLAHLPIWARQAVSPNPTMANEAIESLRAAGPAGLEVLVQTHQEFLQRALKLSPLERSGHSEWVRLKTALDEVGAQCDNWAAKLYWFTDLEKAKAQAQKTNKPILSLRLLGNLNDELSCANSRFFRTALYPNQSINTLLKNDFVLHWQSVRPVPKVTIDFGDGRKIETTITGNSIHYVLDAQGRVLDGLPGLYGPGAFTRWLESSQTVASQSAARDGEIRDQFVRSYHEDSLRAITERWQNDVGWLMAQAGRTQSSSTSTQQIAQALLKPESNAGVSANAAPPEADTIIISAFDPSKVSTAREAARRAIPKMRIERPLLSAITVAVPRDRNALQRTTTDVLWTRIAELHEADAKLDENSLQVLRGKSLNGDKAAFNFQKSIAEDTVRNEYSRHAVIHQWLIENPNFNLDALNKKVYAELFLTPDSDPWLGLLPGDAYTAIANDGVVGR